MLTPQLQRQTQNSYGFVLPQYEGDCISNIPKLVMRLLHAKNSPSHTPLERLTGSVEADKAAKIVLLVVDGFGFNQLLNHHSQNPFLQNLSTNGEVTPITSIYPTQTTNALTTLNTGLTPQEHGLFEYFLYLKEVGTVNSLRFERIDAQRKVKLESQGFKPSLMFGGRSIHRTLKQQGINSYTHIHSSNADIACSKLIFDGSTITPAVKTSDLIVNLRKNLEASDGGYFFVHIDNLDTVSHEYGPESQQYSAELGAIGFLLQRELVEKINHKTAAETLLLMTADHGGVQVDPEQTVYLNLNSKPLSNRETGRSGRRIYPTGSPRDIFLHVKPERLLKSKEQLAELVSGKAEVMLTSQALKDGYFGLGKPCAEFLERAGNLLVLPYGKETVWFANREGRKLSYLGQHGGLCREEMLVPFAAANLGKLKKQ